MTDPPTVADERNTERIERGRRWTVVLKAVARGEVPPGTTPDDFDWTKEHRPR